LSSRAGGEPTCDRTSEAAQKHCHASPRGPRALCIPQIVRDHTTHVIVYADAAQYGSCKALTTVPSGWIASDIRYGERFISLTNRSEPRIPAHRVQHKSH